MTGRLIRFPIAEPLKAARVAATDHDRAQLKELRDQVEARLEVLLPPASVVKAKPKRECPPYLAGLPEGPRGDSRIEWEWIRRRQRLCGPYPYLLVQVDGRCRSIYLTHY